MLRNLAVMTRRRALLLGFALSGTATAAVPEQPAVTWNPHPLFVGAPVLIRTTAYSGSATWLDKQIDFRKDTDNTFSALAGVGLDRAPGTYPLVFDGQTVEVA